MTYALALLRLATRPFDDSTDSLLRFAMRADATLSGTVRSFHRPSRGPASALTGLSSVAEYSLGAFLVLGGLAVYRLAAAPNLRRVGVGVIVANIVFTVAGDRGRGSAAADRSRVAATLATGVYFALMRTCSTSECAVCGVTPVPPVRAPPSDGGERRRIGSLASRACAAVAG